MSEKNDGKWLDFATFRKNLRSLIDSKGIMIKDLAEKTEMTPTTISRYLIEQQREPNVEYLYRIATYFGVSIDWLLGVADDKMSVIPPEARRMTELYFKASKEDQAVINTVLRKYDNS